MTAPKKIRIPSESDPDGRFYCVGVDRRGNQFMGFVTGAFPKNNPYPNSSDDWQAIKRWYAVVHYFDREGNHLRSNIQLGGTTAAGQAAAIEQALTALTTMHSQIDRPRKHDIFIKTFALEHEGYLFGLIHEVSEEGIESMTLQPNDIMFHPPWDSAIYST